jgi:hypothetical protein
MGSASSYSSSLTRRCSSPSKASSAEIGSTERSVRGCADLAFLQLRATLREWFPRED